MIEIFRNPTAPINRVEQRLGAADGGRIINAQAVQVLAAADTIEWGGIRYTVPRISYLDGLELHTRWLKVADLRSRPIATGEDVAAIRVAITELLDHCSAMIRPTPRENPFLHASIHEVGQIASFFFARSTSPHASRFRRAGEIQTPT